LCKIHWFEARTPNENGSKFGRILKSDSLFSTKGLVGCSISRIEGGKSSTKTSQKKNEKKVAMIPNGSTKNSICSKTLEAENEGSTANKSCEEKQQMVPVAMIIYDIDP